MNGIRTIDWNFHRYSNILDDLNWVGLWHLKREQIRKPYEALKLKVKLTGTFTGTPTCLVTSTGYGAGT